MQTLDMRYFSPGVLQAMPTDDFCVYAYCNDGGVRLFDVKPLIEQGGVFAPLADLEFFKSKITVLNDTVAWDASGNRDPHRCIDIDPCTIFAQPMEVDPLEVER
ncbi:MAG: hypothetical protein ACRC46_04550 [Thermoguttaceae bacterium]